MRYKLLIIAALVSVNLMAQDLKIWNDFTSKNRVQAILPDFSYAGVFYSEKALPEVDYKVYNITDFGAKANDGKSDKKAIVKAIKAAEKNGSGIIEFPAGRFLINEDSDEKTSIFINKGHIVFRGAGDEKGGTEIFMKNDMKPVGTPDKIDGKFGNKRMKHLEPIIQTKHKAFGEKLAHITEDAHKGVYKVHVNSTKGLRKDEYIAIELANKDIEVIKAGIAPLKLDERWKQIKTSGLMIKEIHRIKKIKGNHVEFYEPLRIDVVADWNFKIIDYQPLEYIGFENIHFIGNFKTRFKHHGSAVDDTGWMFISLNGVASSWVKNCTFINCTMPVAFKGSAYSTAIDIKIKGNGGHYGVRTAGSTGILFALIDDTASQWHATGVAKPGVGNVIWRCTYNADRCWESHATQPRATLFDCVKGGFEKGFAGGAVTSLPNHLHDLVLWNFEEIGEPNENMEWYASDSKFWKFYPPIIVGFHGVGTTFDESQVQYIESQGKKVEPESLFEAQLKYRLGKVPEWLDSYKK